MAFRDRFKKKILSSQEPRSSSAGVALFMVLSAVSVLALLVVEFTYVAQLGQAVSFGALDQLQAFYTAKSGLKMSLLRLKIFQQSGAVIKSFGIDPKSLEQMGLTGILEQIWKMPFALPVPKGIPGLSTMDQDAIEKFNQKLHLAGSFSAQITSESQLLSLNFLIEPTASSSTGVSSGTSRSGSQFTSSSSDNTQSISAKTPFQLENQKQIFTQVLSRFLERKAEEFPQNDLFRSTRADELVDQLAAWSIPGYPGGKISQGEKKTTLKQAPFYHVSELFMVPGLEEELATSLQTLLSASPQCTLNINTASLEALWALFSELPPSSITEEDVKQLIKYRDQMSQKFKDANAFFDWTQKNFSFFLQNQETWKEWKEQLSQKGIQIVTEETRFKISVEAKVGKSTKTIEMWVDLESISQKDGETLAKQRGLSLKYPYSGLRISFLRIY